MSERGEDSTTGTLSADERAAMKERAAELRAQAKRAKSADKAAADRKDCEDAIAKMEDGDRKIAERVHAIVGENGRGKSSLLHVLAGRLIPESGTVQRIGTLGIAEQELSAPAGHTVAHTVAAAIAAPLAALAELDAAALALADGGGAAGDAAGGATGDAAGDARYATALARAEALNAWDAERRVHIAQ